MTTTRSIGLEAIVLAGGLGTRLRTEVADLPKPMAPVNKQPFLNYILAYLRRQSVRKVILATSYLHETIEGFYGNHHQGIELDYSIETTPLGTGGGIRQAFAKVATDEILIINGDTFFDANILEMYSFHQHASADMTIALKPMKNIARYGIVKTDGTRVVAFEEKKEVSEGYINAGVYISRKDLFDSFDLPEKFSIEEDFLKRFTDRVNIHAHVSDAYFIDIGIPEDYQRAQTEMKKYE